MDLETTRPPFQCQAPTSLSWLLSPLPPPVGRKHSADLPEAYSKTASVCCFSLVLLLIHVLCRKPATLEEEAHGCPHVGLLSCQHQASARLGHPAKALSSVHLLCLGLAWRVRAASWPTAGPHGAGPAGLGGACVAGWGPSTSSPTEACVLACWAWASRSGVWSSGAGPQGGKEWCPYNMDRHSSGS